MQAINLIRLVLLRSLDLRQDKQCLIDSLPIPVVQFHSGSQFNGRLESLSSFFWQGNHQKTNLLWLSFALVDHDEWFDTGF